MWAWVAKSAFRAVKAARTALSRDSATPLRAACTLEAAWHDGSWEPLTSAVVVKSGAAAATAVGGTKLQRIKNVRIQENLQGKPRRPFFDSKFLILTHLAAASFAISRLLFFPAPARPRRSGCRRALVIRAQFTCACAFRARGLSRRFDLYACLQRVRRPAGANERRRSAELDLPPAFVPVESVASR